MNSFRTFERLSSLLAFVLSGLLHIIIGALVIFLAQRSSVEQQPAMGPKTVNLSFAQIELQPAAASSRKSAPVPVMPVPPPEPADVALKEIQKQPETEPEPKAEPETPRQEVQQPVQEPASAQTAQMAQAASAPRSQIESAESLAGQGAAQKADWREIAIAKLRSMIEYEKYYPAAAQKAGYTGRISVQIRLEPGGTIVSYEVKDRRGHPLLGKAVETTMEKIKGRNVGLTLPEPFEVLLPIEFELN